MGKRIGYLLSRESCFDGAILMDFLLNLDSASFINMNLKGFAICRIYSVVKWSAVYI